MLEHCKQTQAIKINKQLRPDWNKDICGSQQTRIVPIDSIGKAHGSPALFRWYNRWYNAGMTLKAQTEINNMDPVLVQHPQGHLIVSILRARDAVPALAFRHPMANKNIMVIA
eukprot:scaffold285979_cov21-Tisochrysis_lutea.AAC.1